MKPWGKYLPLGSPEPCQEGSPEHRGVGLMGQKKKTKQVGKTGQLLSVSLNRLG